MTNWLLSPRQYTRWAGSGPRVIAAVVLLVALAGACTDAPSDPGTGDSSDSPRIVATTSIWADIVANVACDGAATVTTIVPIGGDPHGFEPSLADRGEMEAASLVVANGLGLEEGLDDVLAAIGTPVFTVTDHLDTIGQDTIGHEQHDDTTDHDDDEASDHSGADPHVWFDPLRVAGVLPELADVLVEAVGLDRAAIDSCLADYGAELDALDAGIGELVAAVPADRRMLVTNHDSLGYFADRYGFEVVGTVIPSASALAETNPAQLEALALAIEDSGVPAIFADESHSTDDADALAVRLGDTAVVTLFTGSLGEPGSGADTYVGLLLTDARLITDALA